MCEVLSPSTARRDQITKLWTFHRCGVGHYWIVVPEREVLAVQRWSTEGYVVVLPATRGETVRAEPFAEVELAVGESLRRRPRRGLRQASNCPAVVRLQDGPGRLVRGARLGERRIPSGESAPLLDASSTSGNA